MATKITFQPGELPWHSQLHPTLVPQPGPFGAVAAFTSTPQLDLVAAGESSADFQMSTAASAGATSPGGVSGWGKVFVQICCLLCSWLACLHAKLLLALAYLHGSQRDAEKYRIYKSISIYTIRTIPKIGWLQRALTTNNLELTNE
jgi:hypothetical protein